MWQRLGIVYEGPSLPGFKRAQCPIVVKGEGTHYRMYFTSRYSSNKSHVLSCDFQINTHGDVNVTEECLSPILAPGILGSFDEDGAMASCVIQDEQTGVRYLYYTGWNTGVHVPFKNLIGVAKSSLENGKLKKVHHGPLLGLSLQDAFSTITPTVYDTRAGLCMIYASVIEWTSGQTHILSKGNHKPWVADCKYELRFREMETYEKCGSDCHTILPLRDGERAQCNPTVLKWLGNFHLFFAFRGDEYGYRVGHAWSNDGRTWIRDETFELHPSDIDGDFDYDMCCYPCAFEHDGELHLLYNGNGFGESGVGMAKLTAEEKLPKQMQTRTFWDEGYVVFKNLFPKSLIHGIRREVKQIFLTQMIAKGIVSNTMELDSDAFDDKMGVFFRKHLSTYLDCGKQAQHLWSLHELSLSNKIKQLLLRHNMKVPHVSTRPVVYINGKHVTKEAVNHTVSAHQDFVSTQGSINSVVIWIPLLDVMVNNGALQIVPKSHLQGVVENCGSDKVESFSVIPDDPKMKYIDVELAVGDALLFSSLLVHRSGQNDSGKIRYFCHFRYNDLAEQSFIDRGYPHAYNYFPTREIMRPEFATKTAMDQFVTNLPS